MLIKVALLTIYIYTSTPLNWYVGWILGNEVLDDTKASQEMHFHKVPHRKSEAHKLSMYFSCYLTFFHKKIFSPCPCKTANCSRRSSLTFRLNVTRYLCSVTAARSHSVHESRFINTSKTRIKK